MNTRKAVIYARQSSGKEEESESIAMQLELCRELARKQGLEVLGEFFDANSSGRLYPEGAEEILKYDLAFQNWYAHNTIEKKSRPGLRKALELLGQAELLLVYDMTRLYRPVQNSFLQGYLDSLLVERHCRVLTVKEGESNPSNFSDSLVSTIKSHVNDNQIRLTSEKSRLAMAKLKDAGFLPTGARMFGIRYLGGKERKLEVVPEQAEVIRFIFQNVLELKPFNWIVRQVNERFRDRIHAKCFYKSTFRNIVAQPLYSGYMYDSHGALIEAKQMAGQVIVPFADWQKSNDIVSHNSWPILRRKSLPHPFSGLLLCGNCGAKLQVGLDGDKEFYHCANVLATGSNACRHSRVTVNLLRPSKHFTGLTEAFRPILLLAVNRQLQELDEMQLRSQDRTRLNRQIQEYQARLAAASEEYIEGRLDLNTFGIVQEKANLRIKSLCAELLQIEHALAADHPTRERLRRWLENLPEFLEADLQPHIFEDLLRSCVVSIRCHYDRLEIQTIYGDFILPRRMTKAARNFPHFTYQCKRRKGAPLPQVLVTYHYQDGRARKPIASFPILEIFADD